MDPVTLALAKSWAEGQFGDSRIVEMGSNSNGHYVRWENGLQVCFGRWQLHPNNRSDSYVVRTGSFDWVFPAGFLSVPLVVAMGESEYWGQPWQDSTYPINDYGGCSLSWGPDSNRLVPSGTSTRINYWYRIFNGQLYMHALAVGRWK